MIRAFLISTLVLSVAVGCKVVDEEKKPEPTTAERVTNLFTVINDGLLNDVNQIINEGKTDLNGYNENGQTPLMVSVLAENSLIATALINAGAKIYKPERDNSSQTALSKTIDAKNEIKRVFQEKVEEYQVQVDNLITQDSYKALEDLYESDYLPVNFKLADNKDPLDLMTKVIEAESNQEKKNFIKYLLRGKLKQDKDIEGIEDQVLRYASINQDKDILALVLKQTSSEIQVQYYEFESDPSWLVSKQKAINESGKKVDLLTVKDRVDLALATANEISPKLSDFLSEAFKLKNEDREINSTLIKILKEFKRRSANKSDLAREVNEILKEWSLAGLNKLGSSRDELVLIGVRLTEGLTDLEMTKELLDQLLNMSSQGDTDFSDSLKAVVSSSQEQYIKEQVFRKIYSYTSILPAGLLAEALKADRSMLQFILSGGFSYKKHEQNEVIKAAIESAGTGQVASSYLTLLVDNGISIGSRSGIEALEAALEKLWNGNNSFHSTIKYLVSHPVDIINYTDDSRLAELLLKHFEHIRKTSSNWDLVSAITEGLKRNIETKYLTERTLYVGETPEKIKATLVWDYVLTVHELHRKGESDFEPMLLHLDKLLEVFSETQGSMAGDKVDINPEKYLPHSMLGMTLMVLLSDELSLNEDSPVASPSDKIVWDTYPLGELFDLSKVRHLYDLDIGNKEFWVDVLRKLVRHQKNMPVVDTRSSSRIMRALLRSGLLIKYPELSGYFAGLKITENQYSRLCNYNDRTAILQGDKAHNIGSFNALWESFDKTCTHSTLMKDSEIKFLEQFISVNLPESSSGGRSSSADVTSIDKVFSEYGLSQFGAYSDLGVSVGSLFSADNYKIGNATFNTGIRTADSKQIVSAKISPYISWQTKLTFLGDWSVCAEKIADQKLIDLFSRLKEVYEFGPYPSYAKWKYCRWKGR